MKDEKVFNNVIEYLSSDIKSILLGISNNYKGEIEEVRLRNGSPLNISISGEDYFITKDSKVYKSPVNSVIIDKSHIDNSFQLITNYSIYAFSEEIKNGFITIKGGHRVGIGGKIIYDFSGIKSIKNISSLNIRIAKEKIGISDGITKYLIDKKGSFLNTLIISPPQCGKTTLLRDLIRNLSNGNENQFFKGFKVGLIDERSEIAGIYNGEPQNNVGIRTDILDGCLKPEGIIILIRAMSPEIIAVDEIGSKADIEAIEVALRAGVSLIATVHGNGLEELNYKANMSYLIKEKIFKRYIILDRSLGVGTIKEIINGDNNQIIYKEKRGFNEINTNRI